jgi:hypothetical protein
MQTNVTASPSVRDANLQPPRAGAIARRGEQNCLECELRGSGIAEESGTPIAMKLGHQEERPPVVAKGGRIGLETCARKNVTQFRCHLQPHPSLLIIGHGSRAPLKDVGGALHRAARVNR